MARQVLTRAVPAAVAVLAFLCLSFSLSAWAQVESAHEGGDASKCSKCGKAFEKALKYCLENLQKASFMEKIAIGILLLAEGGHPQELETCIAAAMRTPSMIGTSTWSNWYIGFGAFFLAEVYKRQPREDIKACLEEIIEKGAEHQEPTGGWFSKKGAAKPAKYPGEDHGQLTAMIFSAMISMKKWGMKVPAQTLSLTEAYMLKQCGGGGITYGTGNGLGDTTGSRGGFAIVGLDFVGRRDHKIVSTYQSLFPRCFPRLRNGHHIGGWHFMGVILGCYTLGSDMFAQLYNHWAAKLVAEQRDDGGFYLGDDEASGGEKGLFGGDRASTASLALLILLKNHPNQLKPPKGGPAAKKPAGGAGGGGSPFGRRKTEEDSKQATPPGK